MKTTLATLLLLACSLPLASHGQTDATQLYGTVTTLTGDTYTGPIRWGKEEVSWFDIFNGTKEENPYLKFANEAERNANESDDRSTWNWSWNGRRGQGYTVYRGSVHVFAVPFGAIDYINVSGNDRAELTLRDGRRFYLNGGSNDLGTTIQVLDPEIGILKLEWERIEKVQFSDAPSKTNKRFGQVLYGTVECYAGTFEGFIQWDHDERVTTDKLDGDTPDGDVSIDFGNIQRIERDGIGSLVVLNSGRELRLRGSNDVNSSNRGIIVYSPTNGGVDIPWREFKSVTFSNDKAPNRPTYKDYNDLGAYSGTVKTVHGESYSGVLVYDLDEDASYELIQGKDKGIEYQVPIFLIRRILPKSSYGSSIELKNGTKLFLEDSQDVTDRNDGLLVFKNKDDREPQYIRWRDIDSIELK